ncbi:MAG: hypothetical protein HOO67_08145, partial [Candidatus Peribacteraceae bacterium]|nr:hypothetical protein [Candidatus Peribacteraceae bacterium]
MNTHTFHRRDASLFHEHRLCFQTGEGAGGGQFIEQPQTPQPEAKTNAVDQAGAAKAGGEKLNQAQTKEQGNKQTSYLKLASDFAASSLSSLSTATGADQAMKFGADQIAKFTQQIVKQETAAGPESTSKFQIDAKDNAAQSKELANKAGVQSAAKEGGAKGNAAGEAKTKGEETATKDLTSKLSEQAKTLTDTVNKEIKSFQSTLKEIGERINKAITPSDRTALQVELAIATLTGVFGIGRLVSTQLGLIPASPDAKAKIDQANNKTNTATTNPSINPLTGSVVGGALSLNPLAPPSGPS